MSAQDMRSLVCAFVKPAREEGLVRKGEAGDSKSHCQVVMFRGTEVGIVNNGIVSSWRRDRLSITYGRYLAVCF